MVSNNFVTRFAPSPTGRLHLGHAFSALVAFKQAQAADGRFLLRIEDIDQGRCRAEFTDAIYEDLAWLGLKWHQPVRVQSEYFADYQAALQTLIDRGVAYPCFCTRKDILQEVKRAASAPHGPEGAIYPGTCRDAGKTAANARIDAGEAHAWRLNLDAALAITGRNLTWRDKKHGIISAEPHILGDVVLARKDTPTSYHLSVVCDDALQAVTHVIRGEDLFHTTHIHVVLQQLLGLSTPRYHHHKLLTDSDGKRFAKRDKSQTLAQLRANGTDPEVLIKYLLDQTGA